MKPLESLGAAALLGAATMIAPSASASVSSHPASIDLANVASYSFGFDGGVFTFSATGDLFNPLAVATSGAAEIEAFGGFLGIPVEPSSNYVDRGTVIYDTNQQYAAFPTTTTVPYSNGDNFIGLEAADAGQTFYGFAYTTNTTFDGYAFETSAGAPITATTAITAAPEPAAWALMMIGIGVMGATMRRRHWRALSATQLRAR